jgi:phosphoribosyl 1,2-cyclic phosphodiesterase
MNDSMTITFWGVRGSYPVTSSETSAFGGDTPCVEIRAGEQVLILDAGTGMIALGKELVRCTPQEILLLLSHWHHDHTQGLPFFAPLYQASTRIQVMAPAPSDAALENQLAHIMAPPTFPVHWNETAAQKTTRRLAPNAALKWNPDPACAPLEIRAYHSLAHPGGVMVYRVNWRGRSVVYATDIEGYAYADRRLISFALDADVLIHDAQYTTQEYLGSTGMSKQGWGHSTPAMALDVARAAGVQHLILFHHDPQHNDDTIARNVPQTETGAPRVSAAQQGLCVELHPDDETTAETLPRAMSPHAAIPQGD